MKELLRRINERAEIAKEGDIESDGEYFEDKLLFDTLKEEIDGDTYSIINYDFTENILYTECWTFFLQIFEVLKNGEHFGYIGRRINESCCGDTKEGIFVEAIPRKITITDWVVCDSIKEDYI